MNDIEMLMKEVRDLGIILFNAKNLVDDGKEVLCSRKLQGAAVKCSEILTYLEQAFEQQQSAKNMDVHPA